MGRRYHYPQIIAAEGKYLFQDYKGDTSKLFISATKYENGFSQVKRKSIYERPSYRDLVGNVTDNKTELGTDFYRFCKGELTLAQLPAKHFVCYPFYQAVIDIVWTRLEAAKANGKMTENTAFKKFERALKICHDKHWSEKARQKRNKAILKDYYNEK